MAVLSANGRRKRVYEIVVPIAAASTNQYVYTATQFTKLRRIRVLYDVASTSGTLAINKCTVTASTQVVQAPGSGTAMTSAATTSLSATARTVYTAALSATGANVQLQPGDSIAFVVGGTMTNLAGGVVTLVLEDC